MNNLKICLLLLTILLQACATQTEPVKPSVEVGEKPADNSSNNLKGEKTLQPSADTLTVALTLLRKGKQTLAAVTDNFIEGDGLRLNISSVQKGHLVIFYKGSDGDSQVIFPNKDFFKGENLIEPNKNIVIPGKGWFFFDEKKGTETIFIVFSESQKMSELTDRPAQTVESLAKTRRINDNSGTFKTENGLLVRVVELNHK